jgi:hypothetical protein
MPSDKKPRFPLALAAAAVAVVIAGVVVALAAGPVYLAPLAIVVVLAAIFLGSARTAARSRDAVPAQGLDEETPLGDTDQHSRSSA